MNNQPDPEHPRQSPDAPAPDAKPRPHRWLRRLLYFVVALPILLVALLALVTSGPVLRLVMPTVERAVSEAIQGRFEVGDLHGSLWTNLVIDHLMLESEASGLEVEARRLQLAWSPLALLGMTLEIDRLAADSLRIVLPRPGDEQEPEAPPDQTGPLSLPLAFRLEELSVPQFHLVDPGSGRQFSSSITASGAVEQDLSADLTLSILPLADGVDQLRADLAFSEDKKELRVDLDASFARDGMVMTLAGLPPDQASDVTLSLHGDGSVRQWQGELAFSAAEWAELSARLGLQLQEDQLGFTVSGTAETLGRIAAQLPEPAQGQITLDAAGNYELQTGRLALSRIELARAELLDLSGSAMLDPAADRLLADLQAEIGPAASRLLADSVRWQHLTLEAHAEGSLAMPEAHLTLKGRAVTTPVSTIGELSITASSADEGEHLGVALQASARANAWHDATLAGMLGDRLDIAAKAEIAPDFSRIVVEELTAATAGIELSGHAALDGSGRVSAAELQAELKNLSIFSAISGLQLSGTGRVVADDVTWGPQSGGEADIEITADQLALGQADLDRLVGPQPVLAAEVKLSPRLDLTIDLHRLQTAMADGAFVIALTEAFKKLEVEGELTVQPGAVPPAAGIELVEAAQLELSLAGPSNAPEGKLRLEVPAIDAGSYRFDELDLQTAMEWTDESVLSLANRLDFTFMDTSYLLQADVLLPPERLQLDVSLAGEPVELTGQLELPGYGLPATGSISLERLGASLLAELGVPLAAGQLTANIDLQQVEGSQQVEIEASADGLRLQGGADSIERLHLQGRISDALAAPEIDAQLEGADILVGALSAERLRATLRGTLTEMQASIEAGGHFRDKIPVQLGAAAAITRNDELRLAVDRLDIDIGSQRIALLQPPLVLTRTAEGELDGKAALAVGEGRLDAGFHLLPDRSVSADADLRDIRLAPWAELFAVKGLSGTLSLTATLEERAGTQPQAQLTARVSEIRFTDAAQLPPLSLRLDSELNAGNATADLTLGQPDLQLLQAEATVPLDLSLLQGRAGIDPGAPISAQMHADTEISRFWPYVPLPDHALAGRLKLDAELSGNLKTPQWEGILNLEDGRYEHLQFGTLLENLRIDGRFDRQGLRISQISADDGAGGSLTGKAEVGLEHDSGLDYQAELTLREMALTRMDELRFWADVDLNITGDAGEADVDSQVTVRRGEVDLAVALPPSVPQLEVENLPGEEQKARQEEDEEEQDTLTAKLDVTVNIPGRLFVRGKGLDSEWGGRLEITGTAEKPRIEGELYSRRGQLDVIGKTFAIRGSKITFTGARPPDPLLNITGTHTTDQLTVIASLSGPASQAKLTLSSEPALPQDEILSRMMFGKSQGSLSAIEAIQLASAASSLLGVGVNLDIVGSLRKFLQMDVLRVESSDDGPSIQVGKYLTEDVYVGTKQEPTEGSTGVVVEIELTPNLKVTNENNDLGNKTGIQFKWDY